MIFAFGRSAAIPFSDTMQDLSLDSADLTWLSKLARALVRDSEGADDLVQETVIAALRAPEIPGKGRKAWLATIARRLAIQDFRKDSSRRARERRVARPEALPDTSELVERAEMAEAVARAARSLDEPYARTILLRFMHGRTPAEIARTEGIPPDTVRRRLRRGLELMRAELMRRDGRTWDRWCLALTPLAAPPPEVGTAAESVALAPHLLSRFSPMKLILIGGPPLALTAVLVRLLLPAAPNPAPAKPAEPTLVTVAVEPAAPASSARSNALAQETGESPSSSSPSNPSGGGFVGHLLTPAGEPIVGAVLEVHGWPRSAAALEEHGKPAEWNDPTGTTDADGRFAILFDPPPAYQFVLKTHPDGFGPARWRPILSEPLGEIPVDIGDARLARSGSVNLAITDSEGEPFGHDLSLRFNAANLTDGEHGNIGMLSKAYSAGTGSLLIEGLAEGPNHFFLESKANGRLGAGSVDVVAGQVVESHWAYDGPGLDTYLRFSLKLGLAQPFRWEAMKAARVEREADGTLLQANGLDLRFSGLVPGSYSFRLDHPYFQPIDLSGFESGGSYSIEATGSAELILDVRDGATGLPVDDYQAVLAVLNPNMFPNTIDLTPNGPTPGHDYSGVTPAPQQLEVTDGAGRIARVELTDLQPGESRVVHLELTERPVVEVRALVDTTLEPLEGLELRAFRAADVEVKQAPEVSTFFGPAMSWPAVTNVDGLARFELPVLEPLWIVAVDEAGGIVDRFLQPVNSPGAVFELLLPEQVTVTGALDTSEPASWTLSLAHSNPKGMESLGTASLRQGRYLVAPYDHRLSLDEEGGFGPIRVFPGEWKFLPVPAGLSETSWLKARGQILPTAGTHLIAAGSEFHLAGGDPKALRGKLEIQAQLDGQPAHGLTVRAQEVSTSMGWTFNLDGAGRADFELPPGTYVLQFSSSGLAGSSSAVLRAQPPETFTVIGGQSKPAVCQLQTARRGLWIRHADGSPPGGESYWLVPADAPAENPLLTMFSSSFGGGQKLSPNPIEHWLHLGTWRLLIDGEPKAEFEWQPGEGPLIVEF